MGTPTTMFYFSFISHVRAAVFFNVLKTLKQLWNAETICFSVLDQFYFTCANAWNKMFCFSFISVLFHVVRAALVELVCVRRETHDLVTELTRVGVVCETLAERLKEQFHWVLKAVVINQYTDFINWWYWAAAAAAAVVDDS